MAEVKLTQSQAKALSILESGANCFLTGEAGTGKSFVLKRFLGTRSSYKNILVCAPTGVAAQNVNGVTLHSTFAIPRRPLSPNEPLGKISSTVRKADIIVIDEISMCRFDVFQFIARYIFEAERLSKRKKQLIVVGDFFQLPPVITRRDDDVLKKTWKLSDIGDGFAFISPYWDEFHFYPIILTEQVRQCNNTEFAANLNKIRCGDTSSIKWFKKNCSNTDKKGIYLFPKNRDADEYNASKINTLPGKAVTFNAIISGNITEADKHAPEVLNLKPGMRVMSLANDSEGLYQNGSLGTVVAINKTEPSVTVKFDNGETSDVGLFKYESTKIVINDDNTISEFSIGSYTQFPLRPGYAVTIHKSQGQTFENAVIDPSCFDVGQLYVALSRLTNVTGLHLLSDIRPSSIKVSKTVTAFYDSLSA